jgi:RES domain-containing protein
VAYSGRGAADNGGRWNRPGIHVVYASASLSLATLEYLVNIESNELPSDLVVIAARIPDDIEVARVSARDLPVDWRSSPSPVNLKKIGEGWLRKAETAVLFVPSAVIPEENNILLNPAHPQFARVLIGKPTRFVFDPGAPSRK